MTIYVVKYLSLMQLTLFNSIFFFCVEQCLPREGHYKLSARARVVIEVTKRTSEQSERSIRYQTKKKQYFKKKKKAPRIVEGSRFS